MKFLSARIEILIRLAKQHRHVWKEFALAHHTFKSRVPWTKVGWFSDQVNRCVSWKKNGTVNYYTKNTKISKRSVADRGNFKISDLLRPNITWIPLEVVPTIVKNMTYVLWVNLGLAILISIFGFYKTFKKWFEDKEKDDPEFPRNSGLAQMSIHATRDATVCWL